MPSVADTAPLTNAAVHAPGSARTPPRGQSGDKEARVSHLHDSQRLLRAERLHNTGKGREKCHSHKRGVSAVHVLLY